MAVTVKWLHQTAQEVLHEACASPENWMALLAAIAPFYKYDFESALLIAAQRPQATACATMQAWNRHGLWVRKGSRAIFTLHPNDPYAVRRVFDIADINAKAERLPKLWSLRSGDLPLALTALRQAWSLEEETSGSLQIYAAVMEAAMDSIADYRNDFLDARAAGMLSGMDENDAEALFHTLCINSAFCIVLHRLQMPIPEEITAASFEDTPLLGSWDVQLAVGAAAHATASSVLRQIERAVKEAARDNIDHGGEMWNNGSREEPLHAPEGTGPAGAQTEGEEEREDEVAEYQLPRGGGRDARTSGGVPDATGGQRGQVRRDASELPEGASPGNVQPPTAGGNAEAAPAGGGRGSETDGGSADRGTGEGIPRAGQGSRPAGVGRTHEQPESASGGDRPQHIDLRLTAEGTSGEAEREPTEEPDTSAGSFFVAEQLTLFDMAAPGQTVQRGPHITQAQIDAILRRAGNVSGGSSRIYQYFTQAHTHEEKAAFLRQAFGFGGRSDALAGTKDSWEAYDARGITVTLGHLTDPDAVLTLPWPRVARRIDELIAAGSYLSPEGLTQMAAARPPATPSDAADVSAFTEDEPSLSGQGNAPLMQQAAQDADVSEGRAMTPPELPALELSSQSITREEDVITIALGNGPLTHEIDITVPDDMYTAIGQAIPEGPGNEESAPEPRIGARLALDGREFRVDSVNLATGRVSLQDVEMFASGYPLFRSEPIALVRSLLEAQAMGGAASRPNGPKKAGVSPEMEGQAPEPAGNYRILDDHLGEGGQHAKADRNIEAIRTLRLLEAENRPASAAEQEILAQYVGWGGIPQIFDEGNDAWTQRREALKGLLSPEEYKSARASTLNAHYTSPLVVRSIYRAIEGMGFRSGNILEPACGTGNFFGAMPENLRASTLYGVELDSLTGRIAQKLYPDAHISIQGFEHASLPDGFFDVAVGNVPFGAYSLADARYDRFHFRIHDYFFAKTLDKVRPGGLIAFVTSKGTMDKQDASVRRYIAQRAELLGAIRLPNTAFKANANTEVTTDILFLQKREQELSLETVSAEGLRWLEVGATADGVPVNQYFLDHPDMLLGTMAFDKSMYGNGNDTACQPLPGKSLEQCLTAAIANLHGQYAGREIDGPAAEDGRTPADLSIPNFSFAVRNGRLCFRRDQWMDWCDLSATDEQRVRGMVALRDLTRELITAQLSGASDEAIKGLQAELNQRYDAFTRHYGLLSSRRNASVFGEDDGYYLLASLEILDDEGNLERKADMFTRRTIAVSRPVEHVESAPEALAVSMAERACVDLGFMRELTGLGFDALIAGLQGMIFQDPRGNPGPYEQWLSADEYLSGDVRQKLRQAEAALEMSGDRYKANVEALRAVQPQDLGPHEIDVRLGATWLPPKDITDFIHTLLHTPSYMQWKIRAEYAPVSGAWYIANKSLDSNSPYVNTTYGTARRSAYKIIEETLNLRDVRVYDTIEDENGNEKRVLNQKETILAQQKQQSIREAFQDWVWKQPSRRERLCRIYNDTFNCIRLRSYDGSHLRFSGMNPELALRPHQKNAVARILYGGNTLLAHTVGAGKTAVMVASIMEKVRIGLGHKALIAVPNHLTEQTATEFLRFFPAARILVATKRDFEKSNRKRFMGRVATGDYDAIIMGHSQFERVPVSKERQREMLESQIEEVVHGIEELKASRGEKFTVKELERTRKSLEARLKRLNSDEDKDAVVTFEELGVDMLYVDEAHSYKNLAVITKMRNVAGINTTEAKKSSDMLMKCQYISEITGNRGVVFATGTPISNSMTELYTMQRYLQGAELFQRGLSHFDAWAATFGETQTAIELAPEGTGYRLKTRFSKFYNLPELMSMFRLAADIQTPDMLHLPVPTLRGGKVQNILTQASEYQKQMVASLGERADAVRKGGVDPHEDNMLRITNDGRLLALDARLIDPTLPDDPGSKVNTCVREALRIYGEGREQRLTQMIFCDLSTPRAERTDGSFDDVYHDLRRKLIRGGIPEHEIAFIHDANTEAQKDALFAKVRKGAVRILIGSTAKMGAGTNVQTRLKALHHLDCPWRPSDLQQRDGRILRQGNNNSEVEILRYITQDTFDAYSYQLVENKQKFISQIFTSKSPMRGAEDLDETALSYAEVKALAAGNPRIREKMDLDVQVARLRLLKSNWQSERYRLEDRVQVELPGEIKRLEHRCGQIQEDIRRYDMHRPSKEDGFLITLMGQPLDKRPDAGERLMKLAELTPLGEGMHAGSFYGFELHLKRGDMVGAATLQVSGAGTYAVEMGESALGNIQRLENLLGGLETAWKEGMARLENARTQLAGAKEELQKAWPQEEELRNKAARLAELNIELDVGGRDSGAAALDEIEAAEEKALPGKGRDGVAR